MKNTKNARKFWKSIQENINFELIYKKSKFRREVNQNITILLNYEAR